MTAERRPAKPLSMSVHDAAKVGAYGGIAVAAWLAGAVAAGHGVAAADSTGSSSGASSSASSAGGSSGGSSSTAHAGPRATGTAKAKGTHSSKPSATTKSSDSVTGSSTADRSVDSKKQAIPAASTTVTTGAVEAAAKPVERAGTLRSALAVRPSSFASSVPESVTTAAVPNPLGLLNTAVTSLLNPFLKPPPANSGPIVPIIWMALGSVRRDVFNQAPTIGTPTTTVQTGQTVTGNIGAIDIEDDALKYTITQGPKYGTLTIDQATGNFTYTPDDINYSAEQTDSFAVSVTDGKFNLLMPFSSRAVSASSNLTVLSPEATRVILNVPSTITSPQIPRFTSDGKTLVFAGTPVAGGRSEIYSISASDTDGSTVTCITCGISTNITNDLRKPVPTADGSGRMVLQSVNPATGSYTNVVYRPATDTAPAALIPIITPVSGSTAIDKQREMRISPDGKYVLFSQIQLGTGNLITAVPIVGKLTLTTNATTGADEYHVDDARVVYPVGEGKQWTPDGKGVIVLGGAYESGNVDDVVVDLATGNVTRLTGNLDYDEDVDMSPNQQWIAICSTRGLDALTPMTRIDRPALLPAYIQGSVYNAYAGKLVTADYPSGTGINVSNQEWLVAVEDDLKGENGIPLFVTGDGYTARSMPSWNADGTSVALWERSISDASDTRLVLTNLKYTTSVGTVQGDLATPHPDWAPALSTYKAGPAPLPPVGAYTSQYGGTAYVTEAPDTAIAGNTLRTVTYTNYVNKEGMILNGTESTSAGVSQASIVYKANIIVTGEHTGSLTADATINKLTTTITGTISSTLDGNTQVLLDPTKVIDDQLSA